MRAILLFLLLSTFLLASTDPIEDLPIRKSKRFGVDLTVGQPIPSVLGTLVGANIGSDLRLSLGAGSFWFWSTYTANLKIFLSESNLTGYFGGGLTYLSGKAGAILFWNLPFDQYLTPYIEAGLDYTSDIGLHLGFNFGLTVPEANIILLPGLSFGWYF